MCRYATFEVLRVPQAVPASRDLCRQTLIAWDLDEMIPDTLLVLSELGTNGLLHAGTPLTLTVSGATGHLEIAVSDGNPVAPTVRPRRVDLHADLDALVPALAGADPTDDRDSRWHVGEAGPVVGGRGLLLVEALTIDWGVTPAAAGKTVWATLPVPHDWRHGIDCPCQASGSTRLASGRTVTDRTGR